MIETGEGEGERLTEKKHSLLKLRSKFFEVLLTRCFFRSLLRCAQRTMLTTITFGFVFFVTFFRLFCKSMSMLFLCTWRLNTTINIGNNQMKLVVINLFRMCVTLKKKKLATIQTLFYYYIFEVRFHLFVWTIAYSFEEIINFEWTCPKVEWILHHQWANSWFIKKIIQWTICNLFTAINSNFYLHFIVANN